jgi:hypothetical protein
VAVGSVVIVEPGGTRVGGGDGGETEAGPDEAGPPEPSAEGNTAGGVGDGPQLESMTVPSSRATVTLAMATHAECLDDIRTSAG